MRASALQKHMMTHKKRKTFKSKNVDKEAMAARKMAAKEAKLNPQAAVCNELICL